MRGELRRPELVPQSPAPKQRPSAFSRKPIISHAAGALPIIPLLRKSDRLKFSPPSSPASIMDFFKAQFTKIPQIVPSNLDTCTVLITGANAGIGLEVAREILKSKPKRLILAVRNLERGNTAATELSKAKSPSTEIDVRQLDQSSFASIKGFAEGLSGQPVDIAILNAGKYQWPVARCYELTNRIAGTWSFKWGQTADGYETDLHVNVLGPSLLSLYLLPNLRAAAAARTPQSTAPKPHLCFVSSGLHTMAKFSERKLPTEEVIAALNDQKKYNGQDRYATSKLIGLLWAKELARRVGKDEIVVNAPNPGFCKTGLMKESSGIMKLMVGAFSAGVGRSPQDGAKCIVDAAIVKGSESHGRYLSEAQIKDEAPMARGQEGTQLQGKMWDAITAELKNKKVFPGHAETL